MFYKTACVISFVLLTFFHTCSSKKNIAKAHAANAKVKEVITHFPIIDTLKKLFAIADTVQHSYGESDTSDHVADNNESISETLKTILTMPQITSQNLDTLLKCEGLGITHSDDKKLWLFSWYENTGGTFKSYINIVYYQTLSGQWKINDNDGEMEDNNGKGFVSNGAAFNNIYKLRSKKDLYLCIGDGIGCTTCIFQTATVVEIQKDSANFRYPAFNPEGYDDNSDDTTFKSSFLLGTRQDNTEAFDFYPKNQTLKFIYNTDDNSPIKQEEGEKSQRIVRKLKFNGIKFIGSGYE